MIQRCIQSLYKNTYLRHLCSTLLYNSTLLQLEGKHSFFNSTVINEYFTFGVLKALLSLQNMTLISLANYSNTLTNQNSNILGFGCYKDISLNISVLLLT